MPHQPVHAEDAEEACDGVEDVPPAAVHPDVLIGQPPVGAGRRIVGQALDGGLQVRGHGDEDVDGDDEERVDFEPFLFADAPLVLEQDETDTAEVGGIELRIVEPPVHIHVGLGVQGPFRPLADPHLDGDEVYRQEDRQTDKNGKASGLGPSGDLIEENEREDMEEHDAPLPQRPVSIDLEKHKTIHSFHFQSK